MQCVCVYMYVCIYVYVQCVCMYVCVCIRVYIRICVYINIYIMCVCLYMLVGVMLTGGIDAFFIYGDDAGSGYGLHHQGDCRVRI